MAAQIVWLRSVTLAPRQQQCSACGGNYPSDLREQELWEMFIEHCREQHPNLLPTRTRSMAARA